MSVKATGLQDYLDRETAKLPSLRILEAGCGSRTNIRFEDRAYWVGIDISGKQLERNNGLHEKIQGDIQVHEFPPGSFDVIVCWDVLEHLERPEAAMQRFSRAIGDGGLIILKVPNLESLKGQLTKMLPHSAHVAWYRYLHGRAWTEREDGGPFKTFLRPSIAPRALQRFARAQDLQVAFSAYYDASSAPWLRRKKPAYFAYKGVTALARVASFGRLTDSEYIIIMKKPRAAASS